MCWSLPTFTGPSGRDTWAVLSGVYKLSHHDHPHHHDHQQLRTPLFTATSTVEKISHAEIWQHPNKLEEFHTLAKDVLVLHFLMQESWNMMVISNLLIGSRV